MHSRSSTKPRYVPWLRVERAIEWCHISNSWENRGVFFSRRSLLFLPLFLFSRRRVLREKWGPWKRRQTQRWRNRRGVWYFEHENQLVESVVQTAASLRVWVQWVGAVMCLLVLVWYNTTSCKLFTFETLDLARQDRSSETFKRKIIGYDRQRWLPPATLDRSCLSPSPEFETWKTNEQRKMSTVNNSSLQIAVYREWRWKKNGDNLTPSLPRVINFKFPLQPHQKYYITQYEELGCS